MNAPIANPDAMAGFSARTGSDVRPETMNIQIEQHGDRFFARLRTHETVYLWADFFSEADARRWAEAHREEAEAIKRKWDGDSPCGRANRGLEHETFK